MNKNKCELKTALDIGYELKDCALGGKKITRKIAGFNVTMHFKMGVCKIVIKDIDNLKITKSLEKQYTDIEDPIEMDELMLVDAEMRMDESQPLIDKIENEIINKYYDTTREVFEYKMSDLEACGLIQYTLKKGN